MSYKFLVGQPVEYSPMGKTVGLFKVIRQMPVEDNADGRKYRIKSVDEGFERTVHEHDLQLAERPSDSYGKPLIRSRQR